MHGVLLDGHVDELDCDAPRSLGAGGIRRSASPFCSDYVVAALVPFLIVGMCLRVQWFPVLRSTEVGLSKR